MKARIAEVFNSVQGEGLYLGEKQVFVRFFECNLSCTYCDTKLDRFTEYEPQELFEEIRLYQEEQYHSISFTGGEPLLYADFLKETLDLTSACGYKHYLETNGTLFFELEQLIDKIDIIAMDLKFPSSSGMGNLWHMHRKFLKIAARKEVFLKAIICQATYEEDLKEAMAIIKEVSPGSVLVLQPNSYENQEVLKKKLFSFKDMANRQGVRTCVIPQIHKVVGIR
ncbi:MAG: 7-carboxy-7-deazaguanine synthase QueE [Candidatus Omnitrophica bacterium]|jgi:organic radical activating enzyme|nr:7-carboxy-7-deazaguanine synthase QueE [Candidatus Omnitrophota bacterium]MDD3274792.1 7-carboxy-7-deazaguanine synthase QueE [Candidatus Omnitrophota bacterium]MDD5078574.1 7-carboxy-7-deazaguanine synthase QueE [Candidatus Omnitrophota bacterium]MDD5725326.1 7-carboxy-7-deazaguanine synthase QueE [Candidatus Omnitrophota bacterium]